MRSNQQIYSFCPNITNEIRKIDIYCVYLDRTSEDGLEKKSYTPAKREKCKRQVIIEGNYKGLGGNSDWPGNYIQK